MYFFDIMEVMYCKMLEVFVFFGVIMGLFLLKLGVCMFMERLENDGDIFFD